jgi:phosphoribosylformylglycinamidine cyclo-ligase
MTENPSSAGLTYAAAGVDLEARQKLVGRFRELAARASRPEVLAGIGPFAGLFALGSYKDPVLVASTDTVGTKGKLAALAGRYESLGHDIVSHCVNDAFTTGAAPLFFMDTIVAADLLGEAKVALVRGVADACVAVGCALLGGETADMPGVFVPGGFDLIGFVVSVAERANLIDTSSIEAGDVLLALPSNGLHTNGYSLARPALAIGTDPARAEADGERMRQYVPELGETLAEALLRPHHCYYDDLKPALPQIKGMAHITGGGLGENVPRILPDGLGAAIEKSAVQPPPIFAYIQKAGAISDDEMYRVFNMGFGMVVAVAPAEVDRVRTLVPAARVAGEVVAVTGGPRVRLS